MTDIYQARARELRDRLRNPPNAWTGEFKPKIVIQPITSGKIAMDVTIQFLADAFDTTVPDILGKCRRPRFVQPRHMFCYLSYYHLGLSLSRISSFIKRDHTSVMSGRNKVSWLLGIVCPLSSKLKAVEDEYLSHYYPAFALPSFREPDLAVGWRKGIPKQAVPDMEKRGSILLVSAENFSPIPSNAGELFPLYYRRTFRQEAT